MSPATSHRQTFATLQIIWSGLGSLTGVYRVSRDFQLPLLQQACALTTGLLFAQDSR